MTYIITDHRVIDTTTVTPDALRAALGVGSAVFAHRLDIGHAPTWAAWVALQEDPPVTPDEFADELDRLADEFEDDPSKLDEWLEEAR